jgi:LuxR family maltose regulon positive regulatory protein
MGMPRAPLHALIWSKDETLYELYSRGRLAHRFRPGDDDQWRTWLDAHTAFVFHGRAGRINVHNEQRTRTRRYWYAYHLASRRAKRYLGKTGNLTFERLEQVAGELSSAHIPSPLAFHTSSPASRAQLPVVFSDAARKIEQPLLLATKLVHPRLPVGLVVRERLLRQLDAALSRRLTLLSAAAGFGKTTLLSAWVASLSSELRVKSSELPRPGLTLNSQLLTLNFRVAWLSLDEGDNDRTRFWAYFIAALQKLHPDLGAHALTVLRTHQPLPSEAFLTILLNEITVWPDSFTVVLDDYHVIHTQAIHHALTFLIDHAPPRMHVVIAGRADPPLPLARWRARSQLTELRSADLHFTAEEAGLFLNQGMGLDLSADVITVLETRAEGWIAGLQLAALSLQGQRDVSQFISTFRGSQRFIMDYLTEEVLDRQPRAVREFLLQTSILERLTAPLCDALTQDNNAQALLTAIERANLFLVPLDDERRWYRYHQLFADLLRHHLAAQPERVAELHRRAAQWFEQNGLTAEAVHHALAIADWEHAANLIEALVRGPILDSEWETTLGWIAALPDGVVRTRPRLCLALARALMLLDRFAEAETRLQDAELHAGADANLRSEILVVRVSIASLRGDTERAIELGRQALESVPEDNRFLRGMLGVSLGATYRNLGNTAAAYAVFSEATTMERSGNHIIVTVMALYYVARLKMMEGRLRAAEGIVRQALSLATMGEDVLLPIGGLPLTGAARVYYQWNHLPAAMAYAMRAIEVCRDWWARTGLIEAHLILARVQRAQGEVSGMFEHLGNAEQLARVQNILAMRALVGAAQAQHQIALHGPDGAAAWAEERRAELRSAERLAYERFEEYAVLVRWLIAQARADSPGKECWLQEASDLLARLLPGAETNELNGHRVELLMLQAHACHVQGDAAQALTLLTRSLALAEPEGYIRLFVDEGEPMRLQIADCRLQIQAQKRAAGSKKSQHLLTYLDRLLAAFPKSSAASAPQSEMVIEPLSEREQEVLRLLAAGRSTAQIAAELVITVGTVRNHLKSIFGKLEAHSRLQAVERARILNLL